MRMYGTQMANRFFDTADMLKRMSFEVLRNKTHDEDKALSEDMWDMARKIERQLAEPFDPCPVCGKPPLVFKRWDDVWHVMCPEHISMRIEHRRYTRATDEWNRLCRERKERWSRLDASKGEKE